MSDILETLRDGPRRQRTPSEIECDIAGTEEDLRRLRADLIDARRQKYVDSVNPPMSDRALDLVPYYDWQSPIIDEIRTKVQRRKRGSTAPKLADETYAIMEGIGRSGIVRLDGIPNTALFILGMLIESESGVPYQDILDATNISAATVDANIASLRSSFVLATVRIESKPDPVRLGAVNNPAYQPSSKKVQDEVEDMITHMLKRWNYRPVSHNYALTNPCVVQALDTLCQGYNMGAREFSGTVIAQLIGNTSRRKETVLSDLKWIFRRGLDGDKEPIRWRK